MTNGEAKKIVGKIRCFNYSTNYSGSTRLATMEDNFRSMKTRRDQVAENTSLSTTRKI